MTFEEWVEQYKKETGIDLAEENSRILYDDLSYCWNAAFSDGRKSTSTASDSSWRRESAIKGYSSD